MEGQDRIAPTNASFQAFVTAMRLSVGEERTRQWLEDLKANDPKTYEKNAPVVEAVAAGEIDVGLVNHYLYLVKEEQPDAPIANHFFASGDPGALVSVAGAGVLEARIRRTTPSASSSSCSPTTASGSTPTRPGQYPLVAGIEPKAGGAAAGRPQGPDVDLSTFGPELEQTVELLRETGYS